MSLSQPKFLAPPAKQSTALKLSASASALETGKIGDTDSLSQISSASPNKSKVNFGDRLYNQRTVSFRTKELGLGIARNIWEKGLRGEGAPQPNPDINGLLASLTPERRESIMASPAPSPLLK